MCFWPFVARVRHFPPYRFGMGQTVAKILFGTKAKENSTVHIHTTDTQLASSSKEEGRDKDKGEVKWQGKCKCKGKGSHV